MSVLLSIVNVFSFCILMIVKAIQELIAAGLKIENQGYPSDYVVINIE